MTIQPPTETSELENRDSGEQLHAARTAYVSNAAGALFDQTRSLHGLEESSRGLLVTAARLADIPFPPIKKKKGLEPIVQHLQSLAPAVTDEQDLTVLATVLAFQHHLLRRKDFGRLQLPPHRLREALTLAALLSIALGLNTSASQETQIEAMQVALSEIWIRVQGPQAALDAAAAQHRARLWMQIGYPEIKIVESAADFPAPELAPELPGHPGILPNDTLAEAGRKVIRQQFLQMLRHEPGTRLGEDIEALHDMRVATRRLRAAFEVFKEAYSPRLIRPHIEGLRQLGRCLGAVRDLDVAIEKAQAYQAALPPEQQAGLQPLLDYWQEQRREKRQQMLDYLDGVEYANFKRRLYTFIQTPGAGARPLADPPSQPDRVFELAPVLIYSRLATVRMFERDLANASIERLHALRIEVKKLRYTVEYFREVLGKRALLVIEELKGLQDHLGALNDAQVATQILQSFLEAAEVQQAELPIAERPNLEVVVGYLAARHAERHQLMTTFHALWLHFNRAAFRRNLALAIARL